MKKETLGFFLLLGIVLATLRLTATITTTVIPSFSPRISSPSPSSSIIACTPTDQDQYVYHPSRLQVVAPCIIVRGTVFSIKTEADGDLHIRLTVDSQWQYLINPVNVSGQMGRLVIEPVCEKTVTQTDAKAICASDTDPISIAGLQIGDYVTIIGRYVLDNQHGGWAELHPLYSWKVN